MRTKQELLDECFDSDRGLDVNRIELNKLEVLINIRDQLAKLATYK